MVQEPDFDRETGEREFTQEDRDRVRQVFDLIFDEMEDSFALFGMFAPYANIVHKILTDVDISSQVDEIAAARAYEEYMESEEVNDGTV